MKTANASLHAIPIIPMFSSIEIQNKSGNASKMMPKVDDELAPTEFIDTKGEEENKKETHSKDDSEKIDQAGSAFKEDVASERESPIQKSEDQISSQSTPLHDDVTLSFPQRLMEILENKDHEGIISWLPAGRSFMIHKKNDLEKEILPKYFQKQSKYSSFTRKLNRWGFQRVSRGPETGAYYHRLFRRGEYRLCTRMSCSYKSTHVAGNAAPERAPEPHAAPYAPIHHAPYYPGSFQAPFASQPPHQHGQSGPPFGPPIQQAPFEDPRYEHQHPFHTYPYPSQTPYGAPYHLHHHGYMMDNYSEGTMSDVNLRHPHEPDVYEPSGPPYHEWNHAMHQEHHLADTHGQTERGPTGLAIAGGPPHTAMHYQSLDPESMMRYPSHHQRLHVDEEYSEEVENDNLKKTYGYQF